MASVAGGGLLEEAQPVVTVAGPSRVRKRGREIEGPKKKKVKLLKAKRAG